MRTNRFAGLIIATAAAGLLVPVLGQAPAGQMVAVPARDLKPIQVFLEGFLREAPGRKITVWEDSGPCPTGFRLVRYQLASSSPAFEMASALFASEEGKAVFAGRALFVGDTVPDALAPGGQERLSRYFSQKAGGAMTLAWGADRVPGGGFLARIAVKAPIGEVASPGALTRDGKWVLFGTFFPLGPDPARERILRLNLAGHPSLGAPGAPVTVVELSDFQCPNCAELEPVIDAAMAKYVGKIRLVHFDLPQWQAHDWAFTAALWGQCVASLSPAAFWDYRRAVFYRQKDLTAPNFGELMGPVLEGLGTGFKAFEACVNGHQRSRALQGLKEAADAAISATPTVLVNGRLLDMGIGELLDPTIAKELNSVKSKK